jgi:hypothetical protein
MQQCQRQLQPTRSKTVQDDRDTARADLNARFERVVGYIAEGNARRRHLQQKMKTKRNKKATRDVMR